MGVPYDILDQFPLPQHVSDVFRQQKNPVGFCQEISKARSLQGVECVAEISIPVPAKETKILVAAQFALFKRCERFPAGTRPGMQNFTKRCNGVPELTMAQPAAGSGIFQLRHFEICT